MTQICGKWLKYGEMAELFDKRLKNVGNLGNLQNIWEMAQIHGTWLKYLRNGFTMLEMA